MKHEELMVGDIVLHDNEPYFIRELGIFGVDRDGNDYPAVCIGKKNGIGLIVERNEIKPIPLTSEILEKNGFIEITARVKRLIWAWKKHGTLIEVNEATPNWYQIVIHKEASDLGDERVFVKYVHELQHALKLCGIKKTIEL